MGATGDYVHIVYVEVEDRRDIHLLVTEFDNDNPNEGWHEASCGRVPTEASGGKTDQWIEWPATDESNSDPHPRTDELCPDCWCHTSTRRR